MLAIHNDTRVKATIIFAANAYAKLSKCQQFTTELLISFMLYRLQTLLQSYQNVSNSQPNKLEQSLTKCCKRLCKVIKMLAIHNVMLINKLVAIVANAYAKLSKCQQFTTCRQIREFSFTLQTLMQSYQNVSNSQLATQCLYCLASCKRFCKVIKMLAIHNYLLAR